MGEDPPTQQKGSFWLSLPGILTASATALGAVTALVTALYTAGIVGQPKPDAKPTPPPVTQVPASTQPAAEESSQKIDDARQQEQTAAEALRKAKAEAEQLRRELTVTKQKEAEARKLAELEAAKRRAEEAERARVAAEAELERLKRERETSRSTTQDTVVRAPDAILDYKAGVSGTDVTVEVQHGERVAPACAFAQGVRESRERTCFAVSNASSPRSRHAARSVATWSGVNSSSSSSGAIHSPRAISSAWFIGAAPATIQRSSGSPG